MTTVDLRRFVAIGLPAAQRRAIEQAIGPVRQRWSSLGWTDPAGWHVTLAFLGRLPEARLGEAREVIAAQVAAHAREYAADGEVTATVETGSRFGGRVLSLTVVDTPDGALSVLGTQLQEALAHAELPVSRREVRPHLTLARGRHKRPVTDAVVREVTDALTARSAQDATLHAAMTTGWPLREIGLWTAHDQDGPAHYEVTAEVPWMAR